MSSSITTINSIAIGGFDGMHKAHQQLFARLGKQGAVVVIETGYANLTPAKLRARYCHYPMFHLELDDIRHLDAVGFVEKLAVMFPRLERIVVGYDFMFGKERAYGVGDLARLFAGEVEVVDEVLHEGVSIHSRVIRSYLKEGRIHEANTFLTRNYALYGEVVTGQGLGKSDFVPTLNIANIPNLLPREGVYATFVRCDDEAHFRPAVTFVGHRVTTDGSFAVETHILDERVEGVHRLEIELVDYVRENRHFESFEALKTQIQSDIAHVRQLLRVSCL
ncbi:MAG: FAD synthetase [Sulfuricurvum sp. PC08-66]|nr:MAG: FAD synthetase [Sulfuricurvum sp. PC08-66]